MSWLFFSSSNSATDSALSALPYLLVANGQSVESSTTDALQSPSPPSSSRWVIETEDDLAMVTAFRFERVHSEQSSRQLIEVFSSPAHGRLLFLNRSLQLSTRESAHYHETLVHVPMAYLMSTTHTSRKQNTQLKQQRKQTQTQSQLRSQSRENTRLRQPGQEHRHHLAQKQPPKQQPRQRPLRALIVGGGDGGSLTEVLRYSHIDHVVQVEWDQVGGRDFLFPFCNFMEKYPYLSIFYFFFLLFCCAFEF